MASSAGLPSPKKPRNAPVESDGSEPARELSFAGMFLAEEDDAPVEGTLLGSPPPRSTSAGDSDLDQVASLHASNAPHEETDSSSLDVAAEAFRTLRVRLGREDVADSAARRDTADSGVRRGTIGSRREPDASDARVGATSAPRPRARGSAPGAPEVAPGRAAGKEGADGSSEEGGDGGGGATAAIAAGGPTGDGGRAVTAGPQPPPPPPPSPPPPPHAALRPAAPSSARPPSPKKRRAGSGPLASSSPAAARPTTAASLARALGRIELNADLLRAIRQTESGNGRGRRRGAPREAGPEAVADASGVRGAGAREAGDGDAGEDGAGAGGAGGGGRNPDPLRARVAPDGPRAPVPDARGRIVAASFPDGGGRAARPLQRTAERPDGGRPEALGSPRPAPPASPLAHLTPSLALRHPPSTLALLRSREDFEALVGVASGALRSLWRFDGGSASRARTARLATRALWSLAEGVDGCPEGAGAAPFGLEDGDGDGLGSRGETEEVATGGAEAEEVATGGAEAEEVATGGAEAEEVATGGDEAEEVAAGGDDVGEVATHVSPATSGAAARGAPSIPVAAPARKGATPAAPPEADEPGRAASPTVGRSSAPALSLSPMSSLLPAVDPSPPDGKLFSLEALREALATGRGQAGGSGATTPTRPSPGTSRPTPASAEAAGACLPPARDELAPLSGGRVTDARQDASPAPGSRPPSEGVTPGSETTSRATSPAALGTPGSATSPAASGTPAYAAPAELGVLGADSAPIAALATGDLGDRGGTLESADDLEPLPDERSSFASIFEPPPLRTRPLSLGGDGSRLALVKRPGRRVGGDERLQARIGGDERPQTRADPPQPAVGDKHAASSGSLGSAVDAFKRARKDRLDDASSRPRSGGWVGEREVGEDVDPAEGEGEGEVSGDAAVVEAPARSPAAGADEPPAQAGDEGEQGRGQPARGSEPERRRPGRRRERTAGGAPALRPGSPRPGSPRSDGEAADVETRRKRPLDKGDSLSAASGARTGGDARVGVAQASALACPPLTSAAEPSETEYVTDSASWCSDLVCGDLSVHDVVSRYWPFLFSEESEGGPSGESDASRREGEEAELGDGPPHPRPPPADPAAGDGPAGSRGPAGAGESPGWVTAAAGSPTPPSDRASCGPALAASQAELLPPSPAHSEPPVDAPNPAHARAGVDLSTADEAAVDALVRELRRRILAAALGRRARFENALGRGDGEAAAPGARAAPPPAAAAAGGLPSGEATSGQRRARRDPRPPRPDDLEVVHDLVGLVAATALDEVLREQAEGKLGAAGQRGERRLGEARGRREGRARAEAGAGARPVAESVARATLETAAAAPPAVASQEATPLGGSRAASAAPETDGDLKER